MSLCIQATLIACDAGESGVGEHIIALNQTQPFCSGSSDENMLTSLAVREIFANQQSTRSAVTKSATTDARTGSCGTATSKESLLEGE